jgi:hypothetical protein
MLTHARLRARPTPARAPHHPAAARQYINYNTRRVTNESACDVSMNAGAKSHTSRRSRTQILTLPRAFTAPPEHAYLLSFITGALPAPLTRNGDRTLAIRYNCSFAHLPAFRGATAGHHCSNWTARHQPRRAHQLSGSSNRWRRR